MSVKSEEKDRSKPDSHHYKKKKKKKKKEARHQPFRGKNKEKGRKLWFAKKGSLRKSKT